MVVLDILGLWLGLAGSLVAPERSWRRRFTLARVVRWAISAVALCAGMVASGWKEWSAVKIESSCDEAFALARAVR